MKSNNGLKLNFDSSLNAKNDNINTIPKFN
jgi:hypothetical protein